jgi:hypothetical protein
MGDVIVRLMTSAWPRELQLVARTAIFSMIVFSVTTERAMGQAVWSTPPDTQLTEPRTAVETIANAPSAAEPVKQLLGPRGRPFVAALFAVPLVTFGGPAGPRRSEIVSPADRFAITQLVGAGYVVNPRFRFGVMGIFNEAFTGLPPGADAWQFGGVAPIAIGTLGHFIIGGGPIIGYRSGGRSRADAGLIVLSGASIPLKRGLALNIAAPVSALFVQRNTVSVAIAVGVAKVF